MNLEELLAGLEKKAGFPFESKDEKKEDKKDEKELKKDEKLEAKDEKAEGKEDKREEKKDGKEGQEKSAAYKSGMQLAQEVMEKVASKTINQTTNKGDQMNKSASEAGKALAQALLTKLAGVGDVSTTDGIPAGVVPNKTQEDLAAQVAEQNRVIQATPGTDGAGNGGTVNQIFDAIVADAQAKGVVSQFGQTSSAAAEGAQNATQVPNQVQVAPPSDLGDEGQEKVAAVSALVNSGLDFDQAVALVKRASDELVAEHQTQVKQAAFNELIDSGVNFEMAVALVKQLS
jgi:hypothetical protein